VSKLPPSVTERTQHQQVHTVVHHLRMEAARARRGRRNALELAHLAIGQAEPTSLEIAGKTVWLVRHGQSAANAASEAERATPGAFSRLAFGLMVDLW
jgi:hypothetical protein